MEACVISETWPLNRLRALFHGAEVLHAFLLRPQVILVGPKRLGLTCRAFHGQNLANGIYLLRGICEKANTFYSEGADHPSDAVVGPEVRLETQASVAVDGVEMLLGLQPVGLHLCGEADASALVPPDV